MFYSSGVFDITEESVVECDECIVNENFAMQGAVASTDNNGILTLKRSTVTSNRAINGMHV